MIFINNSLLEQKTFPDGTPSFRVPDNVIAYCRAAADNGKPVTIEWKFDSMGELFVIQCLSDWLDKQHVNKVLKMPYIPNARMDRVKNADEVFTLKTFANIINSLNFESVIVNNAHSNVSLALINNVIDEGNETILSFISNKVPDLDVTTIMFPDDGACKRYSEIKEITDKFNIVVGRKNRDWRTGEIKGLEVIGNNEDIKDKNILIIDDISSLGTSFYFAGKKLKELGAANVYLYVSHCENKILEGKLVQEDSPITKVFTTDTIFRGSNPKIEVV